VYRYFGRSGPPRQSGILSTVSCRSTALTALLRGVEPRQTKSGLNWFSRSLRLSEKDLKTTPRTTWPLLALGMSGLPTPQNSPRVGRSRNGETRTRTRDTTIFSRGSRGSNPPAAIRRLERASYPHEDPSNVRQLRASQHSARADSGGPQRYGDSAWNGCQARSLLAANRRNPALQRRGRDSNSRYANKTHNGFRDRRIQPLCHPSGRPRKAR
jgi:hypothetical protein